MSTVLYGTGRRKNSIARVWIKPGNGKFTVNELDVDKYFDREVHLIHINMPLEATTTKGRYDIKCTAKGGGKTGQAGAIRMGIARCLAQTDEAMKTTLSRAGFLTRDSRMVERKKYGRMKARRRYQFSKR